MHIVIGTAGHIDHGKTSLVKALTGMDTDRLKEEKERGITTDIGFAFLGDDITIIDVPGHERFIKNMVAGVNAIDFVLFVIAVDDGIMPQTIEHFDIIQLLQIKNGIIVLTKINLVEKDWRLLIKEDIKKFVKNTSFENSPIVEVDSISGEGIEGLKKLIFEETKKLSGKIDRGIFRLPVDRVFTAKGFGTVVTGTVISGKIKIEDKLELLPKMKEVRVRGIQVHGKNVESVGIGYRSAINISGAEKDEIERGDVLATPDYFKPSLMIDAKLIIIKNSPVELKNRERVRLHTGTKETFGRILLLEKEKILPNEEGFAQIKLEEPIVASRLDRFIIRRYSPQTTIGGGIVLDVNPEPHKRQDKKTIEKLKSLEGENPSEVVEAKLLSETNNSLSVEKIAQQTGITKERVYQELLNLKNSGRVIIFGEGLKSSAVSINTHQNLKSEILKVLNNFHKNEPLKIGISKAELKEKVSKNLNTNLFESVLENLISDKKIKFDEDKYSIFEHRINLTPEQEKNIEKIEKVLIDERFSTSSPEEIAKKIGLRENEVETFLEVLVQMKKIIKLEEKIFVHTKNLETAKKQLQEYLMKNQKITISEFKDLINSSRKYALPILVYFDSAGLTEREGDFRILKK